jgi:hypothetical protein
MAIEDPIVAEVRQTREFLLAEAGGFDNYVRILKERDLADVSRLVTQVLPHDQSTISHCAEDSVGYKGKQ